MLFHIGEAAIIYYDGNEPNSLLQLIAERAWSIDTTLELPPRAPDGSIVIKGPDDVNCDSASSMISAMLVYDRYRVPTRSRMDDMKTWASYLGLESAAKRMAEMCTLPPYSGVLYETSDSSMGQLIRLIFFQNQREYICVLFDNERRELGNSVESRRVIAREHANGFGLLLENGNVLSMVGSLVSHYVEVNETGDACTADRLLGPCDTIKMFASSQI
jgi:hypothetical protein